MLAAHAAAAPVTQVHVAVSGFQPLQAASHSITSFFKPQSSPERRRHLQRPAGLEQQTPQLQVRIDGLRWYRWGGGEAKLRHEQVHLHSFI